MVDGSLNRLLSASRLQDRRSALDEERGEIVCVLAPLHSVQDLPIESCDRLQGVDERDLTDTLFERLEIGSLRPEKRHHLGGEGHDPIQRNMNVVAYSNPPEVERLGSDFEVDENSHISITAGDRKYMCIRVNIRLIYSPINTRIESISPSRVRPCPYYVTRPSVLPVYDHHLGFISPRDMSDGTMRPRPRLPPSVSRLRPQFKLADSAQQLVGGFLLAGPFVVTAEVWELAGTMSWLQTLLTVSLVGLIGYAALYRADTKRDPDSERQLAGVPLRFISLMLVAFGSVTILALVFNAPNTFLVGAASTRELAAVTFNAISVGSVFSVVGAATADSVF